ncbi:hypothetical protein LguiA_031474 [Lonicera macranthoides]
MKKNKRGHHFPEELTMEILSRLPIKSLMRFKCVSKSWRNLILSSEFATDHFNHSKNKRHFHIYQYSKYKIPSFFDDAVTDLHIPFPFNSDGYPSIVGSSNGLVCIRINHKSESSSFVVWNPAAREYRYLPKPGTITGWVINSCAGFDFVPGGGICDYKLVLVNFFRGIHLTEFVLRVEVFTRSSNSWKQISENSVPRLGICSFEGVVVNGSIYWPATEIKIAGNGIGSRQIQPQFVACFDMWKERFTRIKGPSCADCYRYTKRLGLLKGSKLAMFFTADLGSLCFDGWIMNGHDQSWTKLFTIVLSPSPDLPLVTVSLTGFWLNGEIIIEMRDRVFLYDRRTNELKDFIAEQAGYLYPYQETLFSV